MSNLDKEEIVIKKVTNKEIQEILEQYKGQILELIPEYDERTAKQRLKIAIDCMGHETIKYLLELGWRI